MHLRSVLSLRLLFLLYSSLLLLLSLLLYSTPTTCTPANTGAQPGTSEASVQQPAASTAPQKRPRDSRHQRPPAPPPSPDPPPETVTAHPSQSPPASARAHEAAAAFPATALRATGAQVAERLQQSLRTCSLIASCQPHRIMSASV